MVDPIVRISVSAKWEDLGRELREFPKQLRSASYQAVKRTADQGRRMIADRFVEQYPRIQRTKIESGDPTKRKRPIISRVSRGDNPEGVITVTEQAIPMVAFRPTGGGMKIPSLGKGSGITVTMSKNRPPVQFVHAFRAVMKSGHEGIFVRRKGAKQLVVSHAAGRAVAEMVSGIVTHRLPVNEMFGPNVYSLMNVPKVSEEVRGKLDALLAKNIESQLARFRMK